MCFSLCLLSTFSGCFSTLNTQASEPLRCPPREFAERTLPPLVEVSVSGLRFFTPKMTPALGSVSAKAGTSALKMAGSGRTSGAWWVTVRWCQSLGEMGRTVTHRLVVLFQSHRAFYLNHSSEVSRVAFNQVWSLLFFFSFGHRVQLTAPGHV